MRAISTPFSNWLRFKVFIEKKNFRNVTFCLNEIVHNQLIFFHGLIFR